MTNLPIILYAIFFLGAVFAPLRWSVVSFLLLSNIDLGSLSAHVGLLNSAKAMVLPIYLLWRFRAYSGHGKITAAPVAWCVLIVYVAVASAWSLFPAYAIKLVAHLIGSLIICLMLMRATKGGFLNFRLLVPVTIGTLAIAIVHWFFLHSWGGETERFTTFAGAQSFAAFITALYCAALSARSLKWAVRAPLCAALFLSVLLNGSRLWIIGLLASSILAIFVSDVKQWAKVVTCGITLITLAVLVVEFDTIMDLIANNAKSNRIAAAITDAYAGNIKSRGLGTYNLRQELYARTIQSIESGSVLETVWGHGTCNGALISATLNKNPDPNRAMHDEWLRVIYEWGLAGLTIWLIFLGSLVVYAIKGVGMKRGIYAKPLLIFLPAFALGLSGENIIAGAGNAVSVGFLVLVAFASIAHRSARQTASPRLRSTVPQTMLIGSPAA